MQVTKADISVDEKRNPVTCIFIRYVVGTRCGYTTFAVEIVWGTGESGIRIGIDSPDSGSTSVKYITLPMCRARAESLIGKNGMFDRKELLAWMKNHAGILDVREFLLHKLR